MTDTKTTCDVCNQPAVTTETTMGATCPACLDEFIRVSYGRDFVGGAR